MKISNENILISDKSNYQDDCNIKDVIKSNNEDNSESIVYYNESIETASTKSDKSNQTNRVSKSNIQSDHDINRITSIQDIDFIKTNSNKYLTSVLTFTDIPDIKLSQKQSKISKHSNEIIELNQIKRKVKSSLNITKFNKSILLQKYQNEKSHFNNLMDLNTDTNCVDITNSISKKSNPIESNQVLTSGFKKYSNLQAKSFTKVSASSAKKFMIKVDSSKARSNSEVLRMCLSELGWQEGTNGPGACDIIWQSCASNEANEQNGPMAYSHDVKINKFPCMNQLLRKGPLTLSLNVMRKIFAEQYDFYPRTWFLPEQFKEFSTDCKYLHDKQLKSNQTLTTFIVKPNDGSQGEGIYLIKDPDDYLKEIPKLKNQSKSYIVQEYIHNPFLIDGLKFDLRIYVVINSIKPLSLYICDEGLVRFATVNYQSPNENNINEIFMHLTNYTLNKRNQSYKFPDNLHDNESAENLKSGQGSKRKLSKVFSYMTSKGYDVSKIKAKIDDLVTKTVMALIPEMKIESAFEAFNSNVKLEFFQIIGFDILLKDDLSPVLLEVNCNPSLRVDYEKIDSDGTISTIPSPIDIEIKKPLVLETLKLAAPKKKIEIIEKIKHEEEILEKEAQHRRNLVNQRIQDRNMTAKLQKMTKFDAHKFPLLSKPSESYKKRLKLSINENSKTRQFSSASDFKSKDLDSNNGFSKFSLKSQSTNSSCLRLIYPFNVSKCSLSKSSSSLITTRLKANELLLLENIADIFIYFTLFSSIKYMTHSDFRIFVNKCNLISEKLTADNLDIIFFDLTKKWEFYNKKRNDVHKNSQPSLVYQGFVDLFLKLSTLVFNEASLEKSLKLMIYYCKDMLKRDGIKSNSFFDVDINFQSLNPLGQDLITIIKLVERTNFLAIKSGQTSKSSLNSSNYSSGKEKSQTDLENFSDLLSTPSSSVSPDDYKEISEIKFKSCTNLRRNSSRFSKKSLFPIFFDTSV